MRRSLAILGSAALLVSTNLGMLSVAAAPASDNPTTGNVPVATSFIYPVGSATNAPSWIPGNSNGYFITQGFNNSCDPSLGQGFYLYGNYYCGHTGVDLASASASDVVHATAAGLVIVAGYNSGFGVMVRIKHTLSDGSVYYSQYEHMAYGSLAVYAGEIVTQDQQLGQVGATGFATGAHLHFEIKTKDEDGWGYTFGNDSLIAGYLDPLPFVAQHELQPTTYLSSAGHGVMVWPEESQALLRKFLNTYQHYLVVSTSDGLRVHSGPGLNYHVLGVALRGAKLGYLRTQGAWVNVALPQNVRGWVKRDYILGLQNWNHPRALQLHIVTPTKLVASVAVLALNVREAPGQSHKVISSIFQGDHLSVLTRTTNWAQVQTLDGTRGWVLRRYLHEPGVAPASAPNHYIFAAAPVLNVRSGPGIQFTVTGSVYKGARMQYVRTTPHWAAVVLLDGTTGWVARPLTSYPPTTAAHLFTATQSSKALPLTTTSLTPVNAIFVHVAVKALNIRSAPGRNHPVIASAVLNTRLEVLSLTTHWAHVALPASRINGWVLRTLTT